MAKLEKINVTSWKQPFKDRKKELTLWSTPDEVKKICKLEDGTKRLLQIQFEKHPELDTIDMFQITSGKEISFPKSFQNLVGPIIFNNPDSYFIVKVLDTDSNDSNTLEPFNTTGFANIKTRIGQFEFRNSLIDYWGCCAVSGINLIDILKASHIKPWSKSDDKERMDMFNGLLLNPMLDTLFDKGYVSFSDSGEIMLSPRITDLHSDIGINESSQLIKIEDQHKKYLSYHRDNIFIN